MNKGVDWDVLLWGSRISNEVVHDVCVFWGLCLCCTLQLLEECCSLGDGAVVVGEYWFQ